ncbi:MAG: hypothetical protein ACRDNY_01475 [Gaiellaceae bacterium]
MSMETFSIRPWRENGETGPGGGTPELHGVVQRLGSPEPQPFRNGSELLERLLAAVQGRGEGRRPV